MKRHVIKRIVSSLGWRAAAAILLGGSDLSSVAVGAGELLELSYGRDQELEADREGVRLMAQAGLPPEALASFFEKLRAKEAIRMPELISTHPGTDKRIAKLRELAGEAAPGVTRDLEIDWVEVRRSLPGSHAAAKP
jgi:predicted Zn-dependent protease